MSATNSLHYQLCVEGARWLHRRKGDYRKCPQKECFNKGFCRECRKYNYVTVELNTYGAEQTDIWGWDGCSTAVIEVKTSHADFLNDTKKKCRSKEYKNLWCGNVRWYLCPDGVIKPDELPENWGLLYWDGKNIKHVVAPKRVDCVHAGDLLIIHSILRREGFPQKIFNYRESDYGKGDIKKQTFNN